MDGREYECDHLLAFDGDIPIGTTRLYWLDGKLKVQRVAVLKQYRGYGVGLKLIEASIDAARRRTGISKLVLDSQVSAIGFYEKLGFVAEGGIFLGAGIEHRLMSLRLE